MQMPIIPIAFIFLSYFYSFIKCEDYVESFINMYSTRFSYFTEKPFEKSTDLYTFTYFNFQAFRQSQSIFKQRTYFSFNNILYSFIFDFSITFPNKKILMEKYVIIDHTYDQFSFTLENDRTFKSLITHEPHNCSFHIPDLFDYTALMFLREFKTVICVHLSSIVKDKVINFSTTIPPNLEYLNFEDLIMRIRDDSRKKATQMDYQLNNTHRVLDYTIIDINYNKQLKHGDYSTFRMTRVDITFRAMDKFKMIGIDNDYVIFDEVDFGEKLIDSKDISQHITFSKGIIGNLMFAHLIKKEMIKFEATRIWLDT